MNQLNFNGRFKFGQQLTRAEMKKVLGGKAVESTCWWSDGTVESCPADAESCAEICSAEATCLGCAQVLG